MLDIHWVTGMDTGPQKNIRGYLLISITVPADIKFHHTHIRWIIIRSYLPIPVPIAISSGFFGSLSLMPTHILLQPRIQTVSTKRSRYSGY
jgi:hypothetical protein